VEIEGIGEVIAASVRDYFDNEHNQKTVGRLLQYLTFEEMPKESGDSQPLADKIFVITGSVTHFKNRKELKERIEDLGGKVTGSVSKNTSYLINNDNLSNSTKNKKAKELEIPILTEEEFLEMIK
ncbi:BRCT domain-containing protein, partial [Eubacterium sp. An11]|uniref:BRCT domain-containing protein n=1 Tax=Eubacterium sp. An11 TaxID=1965542 RepID=UPI0023B97626